MSRSLSALRHEIMFGHHSKDEWLELDREVDDAIANASEDEVQAFVDSGAGEVLDMICAAYKN